MDPQQQSVIQLADGASPAKATPPPTQPLQCDHERSMVVGNMCPSLYLAVYKGRMAEVTALLLQQHTAAIDCQATGIVMHGQCDILELTAERNTALHVAAEQGHHELIRELYLRFRDQGLLSRQNSALDTPLHCAARAGHASAVAVLVELARDSGENDIMGRKSEAGDTALHLAARYGHGATVEVLVSAAAEPAAELNNAGASPLYLAVFSGSVHAVRAIISKCKDASAAGPSAQNALHAAVFQSSKMVHLLLERRPALADQVDSSGSSPLHFASSDGDRKIVNAILRASQPSTVYKKDSGGLSALHIAARMGHHRLVKDMLESCRAAADLRDGNGGTFVHAAAREKRSSSVVRLAVKDRMLRGLLDAQDRDGNTPLHLAVAAGMPDVVEALLRQGKARADVLNNDGRTAFDLVEGSTSFLTMVSLVVTLFAYGAQLRPQRQDCKKQWKSDRRVVEEIGKVSDSFAVVAQLLATAAFAAGFNLPGGYDESTGKSNLSAAGRSSFRYFLILDTLALATAVVAVILLIYGKASSSSSRSAADGSWTSFVRALQCMWVSLISLMLAFYAALYAADAVGDRVLFIIDMCISVAQIFIASWITPKTTSRTILRFLWRWFRCRGRHDAIKRQYPLVGAFVRNVCLFSVVNFLVSVAFGVLSWKA